MQKVILQSVQSSARSAYRAANIFYRFLEATIFLSALVSVVTMQSWRWMDLRFAGGVIEFLLPWLWLMSLVILLILRFRSPVDISLESAWRLNRMVLMPTVLIVVVLMLNTISFYHLKMVLHDRVPWYMPMSLPVLVALVLWLFARPDYTIAITGKNTTKITPPWRIIHYRAYDFVYIAGLLLVLLWIFHGMFLSDPPPPGIDADIAIVFGAGTGPGDTCGYTLRHRVLEGVRLFNAHRVKRLLLTGRAPRGRTNPYDNEPLAMLKLALSRGIPVHSIIMDYHGNNTRYSAYDAAALIKAAHWRKIIAVSSDYHLPRIALALRQLGIHVWTVPARAGIWPEANPWAMVREIAGYPVYWLDRNYHRPEAAP